MSAAYTEPTRSKKTGIQNAQLIQLLANILKKINPHKHKVLCQAANLLLPAPTLLSR